MGFRILIKFDILKDVISQSTYVKSRMDPVKLGGGELEGKTGNIGQRIGGGEIGNLGKRLEWRDFLPNLLPVFGLLGTLKISGYGLCSLCFRSSGRPYISPKTEEQES